MRFVTFSRPGRTERTAGVLEGDLVLPFRSGVGLEDFVALDPSQRAAESRTLGEAIPLSDVRLAAPVRPHKNVFCVGRNYLAHAEEGARARGQELKLPDVPTFFTKAPTAIVGPDEDLHLDP